MSYANSRFSHEAAHIVPYVSKETSAKNAFLLMLNVFYLPNATYSIAVVPGHLRSFYVDLGVDTSRSRFNIRLFLSSIKIERSRL